MRREVVIAEPGHSVECYCHADLSKAILAEYVDGRVGIMPVDPMCRLEGESEQAQIERISKRLPPWTQRWKVVAWAAIPSDRRFVKAWVWGEDGVTHDRAKCIEIQKHRLRMLRAPKLAALDIEYQRADEAGDAAAKAAIAVKKKQLREVTEHPSLTAWQTLDELFNAVPEALK